MIKGVEARKQLDTLNFFVVERVQDQFCVCKYNFVNNMCGNMITCHTMCCMSGGFIFNFVGFFILRNNLKVSSIMNDHCTCNGYTSSIKFLSNSCFQQAWTHLKRNHKQLNNHQK